MNKNDVPNLEVFWAKWDQKTEKTLSLTQHLKDVAGVIVPVSHHLLPAARFRKLAEACGTPNLEKLLQFVAWAHDVGKASPWFQSKVPTLSERVLDAGYPAVFMRQDVVRALPHSLVSAYAVLDWLKQRGHGGMKRPTKRGWFSILGGHHGTFPAMVGPPAPLVAEPEQWRDARRHLLDLGVEHLGLTTEDIDNFSALTWRAPEQAVVTGLLIAADWVGSSEENFPYGCDARTDQQERATRGRRRMDLGGRWTPSAVKPVDFAARFGLPLEVEMRPVQQAVVDTVRGMEGPGMVLVEDATGGGKTEAALMAADMWAEKLGLDGVYFGQPTRVTSDAMFSRVLTWLENGEGDGEVSTVLAHGKAEFNEEFHSLFGDAIPRGVHDADREDEHGPSPEANAWFRGRKTGLLASVVVGTIDQLLFAALRSKHVVLRHLGLVGKVVILDEVHAADDYMAVYLERILQWLGVYGVPVIALSATLPPSQRRRLLSAYQEGASRGKSGDVDLEQGAEYPRISWATGTASGTALPDAGERSRTTQVEFLPGDLEEIADAVAEAASSGGCIAVICNTVSRAQDLFALLENRVDGLSLLHSRFLTDHRAELETDLVGVLGRHGEAQRASGRVVISTQIIEQGLDLDVDLMFSDVAPVDLLIQRMGRLHRHDFAPGVRPPDKRQARFIITGCDEFSSDNVPKFPRGIEAVYRRSRLLRSVLVLDRHLELGGGQVVSPKDVAGLVSAAYSDELLPPASWMAAWKSAERKEEEYRAGQEEKAGGFRLPSWSSGTLEGWSATMTSDVEAQGLAQVRDADDSVEVVVVRRVAGRLVALPHVQELEGLMLDEMMSLDFSAARRLAQCTVRLPAWVMRTDEQFADLEKDGQESWQNSRWLRGALPLVLDENLERVIGDTLLRYDNQLGLLCERREE